MSTISAEIFRNTINDKLARGMNPTRALKYLKQGKQEALATMLAGGAPITREAVLANPQLLNLAGRPYTTAVSEGLLKTMENLASKVSDSATSPAEIEKIRTAAKKIFRNNSELWAKYVDPAHSGGKTLEQMITRSIPESALNQADVYYRLRTPMRTLGILPYTKKTPAQAKSLFSELAQWGRDA